MPDVLRSPYDREIFRLAVPALGALAAEPLLWGMLAAAVVYVPLALPALHRDWGIQGVWAGLGALFAVRLLTLGVGFAGRRWALTGVPA